MCSSGPRGFGLNPKTPSSAKKVKPTTPPNKTHRNGAPGVWKKGERSETREVAAAAGDLDLGD